MDQENEGQIAAMFPGTFSGKFLKRQAGEWKVVGTIPGMTCRSVKDMTRQLKSRGRIKEGPILDDKYLRYELNSHGQIVRITFTRNDR